MTATLDWSSVEVGTQLPATSFTITRETLVRYAGASGDFNVIHWSDRLAHEVGLPGVIAHGMLTLALTGSVVTSWVGDPSAVLDFSARFTRPVIVPDNDAGATVQVEGVVKEIDEAGGTVRVDLTVTCEGQRILGGARALVHRP
jgi:acyl dehydratase